MAGGAIGHQGIALRTLCRAAHIRRQGMGIAVDQSLGHTRTGASLIVARFAGLVLQHALGAHIVPIAAERIVKVHAVLDDAAVVEFA